MPTNDKVDILILGGGVTGLGAATRLTELQHSDWLLIEGDSQLGGLGCTDVTPEGFLFDRAGHVIFSHYEYFNQVLDYCVGKGDDIWCQHIREVYINMYGRMIPYPFQLNIHRLPTDVLVNCLEGLFETRVMKGMGLHSKPTTYSDWIDQFLGKGIGEVFLKPYSYKVWAIPTEMMACKWVGERVATVDTHRVLRNIVENKDDVGWGPNTTFRFPKAGGNATIWTSISKLLPQKKLKVNSMVEKVNLHEKKVILKNGDTIKFNKMLNTAPLELFLEMTEDSDKAMLARRELFHSSTHVIGIGLRGTHKLGGLKFGYFPQDDIIFNRATVFSGYSPNNTPPSSKKLPTLHVAKDYPVKSSDETSKPGPYWSILLEVSESKFKPIRGSTILEDCVKGCIKGNIFEEDAEIVSIYYLKLEHGYPTPTLKREATLDCLLPWLKERNVWSRGRFGSYKYEVSNQDHSFMLGVEAVDNMLTGEEEVTLDRPDYANMKGGPNASRLKFTGLNNNLNNNKV